MNHLIEIAEQVEEFGQYIHTNKNPVLQETTSVYKMDGVTKAHVVRDRYSNIKTVTFLYGTN